MTTMPQPATFLEVRVHRLDLAPPCTGLCAGYESKTWRAQQLASHAMRWLPEFALTYSECEAFNSGNAVDLIAQAAQTVYKSEKFKRRGEFGELFLHIAVRQVFDSIPAISKIYYKTAHNETAKGFDAVHVVGPPTDMELWLGEAKFYNDVKRAIRDVVDEIKKHTANDYLRGEFMLIRGKIDPASPHAEALKDLLHHNTSLDKVFKRLVVPVLLTYDSDCIAAHTECSQAFADSFKKEVEEHHAAFAAAGLPTNVRIHLFLLPLHSKEELIKALDRKLKAWQQI